MDTSLTELESDISRLTLQQERIQRQFFLHGDHEASRRKKVLNDGGMYSAPHSSGRSQWGVPKPFPDSSSSDESSARVTNVYNGDPRTPQSSRAGSNSIQYGSSSFRLHSNSDIQGTRLFTTTRYEKIYIFNYYMHMDLWKLMMFITFI